MNYIPFGLLLAATAFTLGSTACKKKTTDPSPEPAPPGVNDEEVITTFKLLLRDSAGNTLSTYFFRDPDGSGGQPAYYGPDAASQSDSLLVLGSGKTYFGQIVLLDETKTPADSVSKEVAEEGSEHMFFFNNGNNTVLNTGNPYTVQLNGILVNISYTDLDAGSPQRGIGLKTRWRTYAASGSTSYPLQITLRHQPDSKDGTYAPGESDVSVNFKLKVN